MAFTQSACPECAAVLKFKIALPAGKLVRCPRCDASFRLADEQEQPQRTRREAASARTADNDEDPAEKPRKKKSRRDSDERPALKSKKRQPAKSNGLLIGAAVATLLLVVAVGVTATIKLSGDREQVLKPVAQGPSNAPVTTISGMPPDTTPPPPDRTPTKPDENKNKTPVLPPPPPPLELKDRPTLVLDSGGHTDAITRVFFTHDNRRLVTASLDKTVRIWDAHSGECLRTLRMPVGPGREGALQAAALSPDSKLLAVATAPYNSVKAGSMVHLLSLETGEVVRVLKRLPEVAGALAFSPNGAMLAVALMNGDVRVYDATQDNLLKEYRGHKDRVSVLAWSPNSQQLASGSHDTTVCLWSMTQPTPTAVLLGHKGNCISLSFHPNGKTLVSGCSGGMVRLWSNAGKTGPVYTFNQTDPAGPPAPLQFTTLQFNKDGTDLLYTGIAYRGEAGIITLASGVKRIQVPFHNNTVLHGSFSPDGELAATTGGGNNETYIWQTKDGGLLYELATPGQGVWGVAWSEDGKSIAWGNTNRGDTVRALTPLEHGFSLDEMDLIAKPTSRYQRAALDLQGLEMRAVNFYEIGVFPRGQRDGIAFHSPYERDRLYSGSLLPNGKALLGGSYGGIFLVDIKTGQRLRSYTGHSAIILGITPSPDYKYFVTGSSDQTLRIWSVEREEPLLSLFVAGSDWIAWTPEGYYSASANGERLMGWQINNGLEKVGSYYPAIQFRTSLFRPDVIKVLLKAGSLEKALALTGGATQLQVSQVLPPRVEIVSPSPLGGALDVRQNTVEVKAVAQSFANYPVTSMKLLLDGRPYLGKKGVKLFEGGRAGQVEAVWNVAVPPGKHSITVMAESAVSKGMSSTLDVKRTTDKNELPNLYILAVGISDYPGELKLNYAASDAAKIVETFQTRTRGVFGTVEVKSLTDQAATKQAIVEGVNWLAAKMSPVDVGILFFSGHGTRDDAGQFYLVPVNVSLKAPASQWGVSGDFVKEALANMPGRLIAIFDACHSGTVAESFKPSRGDNLVRDLVADDYGVIVLCSSLGREYSLESPATRAGFFTLGLVEGMSGRADFNRDRAIHLNELSLYSALRVKQLSQGEQNPIVGRPPHVKSFVVGRP